jgi:hypothetical protein
MHIQFCDEHYILDSNTSAEKAGTAKQREAEGYRRLTLHGHCLDYREEARS